MFHCIYVPQFLYPFICWWISRLLPCPGYCRQCCSEQWGARVSFNYGFLRVYAQSLEKEIATYCSILAWKTPQMGKPGGLHSTGSQRVGNNWATNIHMPRSGIRWRGCGEKRIRLHCWWECKLIQSLWRTGWMFLNSYFLNATINKWLSCKGVRLKYYPTGMTTFESLSGFLYPPTRRDSESCQRWERLNHTFLFLQGIFLFMCFFSFCLPFILSHTCFRPSWASVVEAQGVGPIREDLGFILSCIIHWWFEFNLLWDAWYKAKRFFFFFFPPLNSERSLLEMWNHNFWRFGDLKKNVDSCWLKNWEIFKSGKYPR